MSLDNIWFTRKARIRSSERLLSNDFHSQCVIVYYSAVLVIVSILTLNDNNALNQNSSEILCSLSVALLVVTLFVSSVNFKGRGLAFKQNYIALQSLYEKVSLRNHVALTLQDIERYLELLNNCENHSSLDDLYARVISAKNKTSRVASPCDVAWLYLNLMFRWFVLLLLYVSPLCLFWWNK